MLISFIKVTKTIIDMTIVEISANRLELNGKLVLRNMDGQWVCPSMDLTPKEEKALYEYVRNLELRIENRKN